MISGFLVMATDVGRFYLIQGELQTVADAAALAAATRLVGTATAPLQAGIQMTASLDSTTGNDNRFNLRMNRIGGEELLTQMGIDYFSTRLDALGNVNGGQLNGIDWGTGVYPKYARVQLSAQAPVMFVRLMTPSASLPPMITVSAVAGISSPVCTACGIDGLAVEDLSAGTDDLNFGFVPGNFYTLYLTESQQWVRPTVTQRPLPGTVSSVRYIILDHVPNGPQNLDLISTLFALGAGGISGNPGLTPPGNIAIHSTEVGHTGLQSSPPSGTLVGQSFLCGLNNRFGAETPPSYCGQFAGLATLFEADTDTGLEAGAGGIGFQDFAADYDGNLRRVLTVAVVDSGDSLSVLNFRQFLIEMSTTTSEGLAMMNSGAFHAQYIGTPVPVRCGNPGGPCRVSLGVGRTVLQ